MGDAAAEWQATPWSARGRRLWSALTLLVAVAALMPVGAPPAHAAVGSVTASVSGGGNGRIVSSPPGIDCGFDCSEDFGGAASVTFSAVQESGSTFAGWQGPCYTVSGQCTMTETAPVGAKFLLGTAYNVIVNKGGTGTGRVTSSAGGIDCGVDCAEGYSENSTVTLTATPDQGSTFAGWSGACTLGGGGQSSTCVLDMTTGRDVTASFTD